MGSTLSLTRSIASFYRRWHALEESMGADNGAILDFDFCPKEFADNTSPYRSRLVVLHGLEQLQEDLCGNNLNFHNHEFISLKLRGANAYLRALMGERFPFSKYLLETMGIAPEYIVADEINMLKDRAQSYLAQHDLSWHSKDYERYQKLTIYTEADKFVQDLRHYAEIWVAKTRERLGLEGTPNYSIQIVQEDAYWTNWINGEVDGTILLRINTHPRILFQKGSAINFAVHEIAAHAVHILELDHQRRLGNIDVASMNMTSHSCEIYQLEGLSQSLIHLISDDGEISDDFYLYEALSIYHLALLQNAHLDLEDGRPINEVIKTVLDAAPFISEKQVLSDLRDRSRYPMLRALMPVYYPTRKKFLSALKLSRENKNSFLRSIYQNLWTPQQIDVLLNSFSNKIEK